MADLDGKVAVVLGASAPGGTGWAIARAFANAGAQLVIAARNLDRLERLAATIDATPHGCDVGDEAQVARLATAVVERYGQLDIAVNAAGEPFAGTIANSDEQRIQESLRTNYLGNVYFVKHMAEAIGFDGSIVLMSTMGSTHPAPSMFAYGCAKAASDCLVRYAALEYGHRRIKVNSILPCSIRSDMTRTAFDTPGFEETVQREVPLGRVGETSDFADAALWLAGPSYVTGLNLQVNGGNHLTRYPKPEELSAVLEQNF